MIVETFDVMKYQKHKSTIEEYLQEVYTTNFDMSSQFCEQYTKQKIQQLDRWLESGEASVIGIVGDKLMGFVWFYKLINFEEERFHIYNIVVGKEYRGMGLSKLLIDEVKNLAVSMKVKSIELNVTASNDIALNLYKAMGFDVERVKLKLTLEVD